jgi:hypothetical protein
VPAPGPIDLIDEGVNGAVGDDLLDACYRAIACTRDDARASTRIYTYDVCRDVFRAHLVPLVSRLPSGAPSEVQSAEAI